jgi:hypothetical protein
MAQSFNIQGKPALGKDNIIKFGPVAGAVVSIFGLFLFLISLLVDWIKFGPEKLSGFQVLFDNTALAVAVRGGFLNGLLCNLPFFLCGSVIVAIFIIAGTFWNKVPTVSKLAGPGALGILTLLSCCPGILFLVDIQTRSNMKGTNLQFGYFLSLFALAVVFLGGLVALGAAIYGGGLPKFNRR